MQNSLNFLKPEIISRLENMELRARFVVEGFITGLHKSPYHGFSVEFAEHRPYMPGDEIRRIDWKVYGKTDRFYIKEYEEETNLKAYILMDMSASMGYGSQSITKLEYSSYLAASLSYLMLKQRDAVGLTLFDTTIQRYLPPRSIMSYLYRLLRELENVKPGGETKVSDVLHVLAERIKRRGLIIIISDLMDDPEKVLSGLKHFRHRQHEVLLFHILDPYEIHLGFEKDAIFQDMETGESMDTQTWHIRRAYQKQIADFIARYRNVCHEHQIDYVLLNTEIGFDQALFRYLIKRRRLM